jgi:hypothetical protein
MLTERKFRITRISPGHGSGIAPTEKPDAIITYRGQQMRIH